MNELYTPEDFWLRTKELMKQIKLSQSDLESKLNIASGTIKQWSFHHRYPNANETFDIAKALNTTVEYLVTGEESNQYKERFDSLVAAIKELPIS